MNVYVERFQKWFNGLEPATRRLLAGVFFITLLLYLVLNVLQQYNKRQEFNPNISGLVKPLATQMQQIQLTYYRRDSLRQALQISLLKKLDSSNGKHQARPR